LHKGDDGRVTTGDEQRDAVVIGAGPNGLVAANLLADAGWDVLLLEAQPTVGGAVRSDADVAPGFVHDTFSSFYPLAAASPTIQGLHLERHGLVWRQAPAVLGTPFDDGTWALLHRDPRETAAALDEHAAGDGGAWLDLLHTWERIGDQLVAGLLTPFPPVRPALGLARRLPRAGGLSFVQLLLSSVQAMGDRFRSEHAKILLAGNAAHADLPADALGSGLMGLLLTMLGHTVGYPVPEGGAGHLAGALEARLVAAGGEVRCNARVRRVVVVDGRAVAVETADGTRIGVKEAVLADVVAPHLYGGLVRWSDLPTRLLSRMGRFTWDPSTVKVDWALDGPIPWASPPTRAPGTVHITESVDHVVLTGAQVAAHHIPADPLLLVGQMTTTDPTRSPAGTESVWAYTHVPQRVVGDLGDGTIRGTWDADDAERMADRMQARLERYAPDFASRVIARRILTPPELERRNESLVGGAINGGTAAIHQQLVFRPVAGLGRSETPVRGLYLASASAHPGGGVHGACGSNAARAAVFHAKLRRLRSR
jgi:phytoene dehydrogenase-like protein